MYLLDANVFISAKNAHYGMDFAPAFWEWIENAHQAGLVHTVQAVGSEIKSGADVLADWAGQQPASFYLQPGSEAVEAMAEISGWCAAQPRFTPAARSTFLGGADFLLVAQAQALGFTVVTHERSEPTSRNIVKIPDVCLAVGVAYVSTWTMLRDADAKFIL